jgi:hypothetical protein
LSRLTNTNEDEVNQLDKYFHFAVDDNMLNNIIAIIESVSSQLTFKENILVVLRGMIIKRV